MVSQLLLNIIIVHSIYALSAFGFIIIYKPTKFFHFTHAVIFMTGAHFIFLFNQKPGGSYYTAIPAANILALLLSSTIEFLYFILSGNRKLECSIRINDQWRICFRFENGNAYEVCIEDYHK